MSKAAIYCRLSEEEDRNKASAEDDRADVAVQKAGENATSAEKTGSAGQS